MSPEEFRKHGHQLIDLIADYRQGVGELPVMAQVEPGYLKAALPGSAPVQGEPFENILKDVDQLLMPGLSHWQHPDFFGYFPSNGTLSSVLGDFLSTGLGVLGLSWQSSPALSELEETTVDWLRQMVGLSAQWSGVIQDTASTSTLVALISARERSSDYALAKGGLQGQGKPLMIYTSAQAHSSVDKAALLAGFGKDNIRYIDTDDDFAMRPQALAAAIEQDLADGLQPCAVVATTGTTATTALDPLQPIGQIAREHGLWLHVDSAMAGSAMILPECRWMWDGIEQADSIVVNAHKWLGVAFDCSLYFVRDPQHLIRVMSTNPSYLQSAVDSKVKNLRDWGIPLGRRFRALKLWFMLRSEGIENLQQRLRRDLDNAQWLAEQVRGAEGWELLAPVQLQTLCIRHRGEGLQGEALDAHTRRWADQLNASGVAYVTPATLHGRWMVRVSVGALPTEREHVAELWRNLQNVVAG
ncbi:aminotransferase class V-fold PLP-dependent enzyme [Pseudomonas sp. BIGb0427]|uniref:DOPA decarboxylase n=1 Tax=unclassified Pseudomonas TaxID=196821 RepID=UPI0005EB61C1|nr:MULTISPECIES: DOPA decarboxylase [unclassified Pseudomonas]KJK18008.1 amino acid decarboxylase [Pseudomonas sp. 2(2015)]QPG61493.1 aminotransferase class V-fold PLP-dependent enzyme [Pseudomonas sp. BIGb0427]UVL63773.1 DOPA decarboxylase [Pseudomonas sp. B21-032]UVM69009.1 DOPA decarboxylase [Pseudomonas sp. B21-009]